MRVAGRTQYNARTKVTVVRNALVGTLSPLTTRLALLQEYVLSGCSLHFYDVRRLKAVGVWKSIHVRPEDRHSVIVITDESGHRWRRCGVKSETLLRTHFAQAE